MTTKSDPTDCESPRHSNRVMLAVAWLVVGLPLAWGVFKSVEKSLPLFSGRSTATQTPSPNPPR